MTIMASSNDRRISRFDAGALLFFVVLFVVWLSTGRCEWLRYLYLALVFLYLFVVRIVVYNRRKKKEEARLDDHDKQ